MAQTPLAKRAESYIDLFVDHVGTYLPYRALNVVRIQIRVMAHETATLSAGIFSRVLGELEVGVWAPTSAPQSILERMIDDLQATLPPFLERLRFIRSLRIDRLEIDLVREIWFFRFV